MNYERVFLEVFLLHDKENYDCYNDNNLLILSHKLLYAEVFLPLVRHIVKC